MGYLDFGNAWLRGRIERWIRVAQRDGLRKTILKERKAFVVTPSAPGRFIWAGCAPQASARPCAVTAGGRHALCTARACEGRRAFAPAHWSRRQVVLKTDMKKKTTSPSRMFPKSEGQTEARAPPAAPAWPVPPSLSAASPRPPRPPSAVWPAVRVPAALVCGVLRISMCRLLRFVSQTSSVSPNASFGWSASHVWLRFHQNTVWKTSVGLLVPMPSLWQALFALTAMMGLYFS